MNESQILTTLALWSLGRDTKHIADILDLDEAIVANELPRLLEQRRSPPSPRPQKTAIELYAAKLRRCGIPKDVIDVEIEKMEAAR